MTRPTAPPDDHETVVAMSRRRLVRAGLVAVPLAGLAYALLASAPGVDEVGAALTELRPGFVLLALVGEAVHVLGMAQAYRSALAAADVTLPYRRQLPAFLAGYGVGQLLPAGGAVGGAVVGQRMIAAGAPRAAAAAAVTLTGILNLLAIALLVSGGLLAATLLGGTETGMLAVALGAVVVLVALLAVALAVVRSPERVRWLLDRLDGVMRRVGADLAAWRSSLDQLHASPPSPRGLVAVVLWALVAWAGNAGALWAVFAGLGTRLASDVLLLGFGVQHLVAMIPISPGGIGLVEAGLAGTYTALGVTGGTAVTAVIGYRLVSFWLPVALGLTAYLRVLVRDGSREQARA